MRKGQVVLDMFLTLQERLIYILLWNTLYKTKQKIQREDEGTVEQNLVPFNKWKLSLKSESLLKKKSSIVIHTLMKLLCFVTVCAQVYVCRHLCTRGSTEELVLSLWIFMEALGIICKLSFLSCKRLITPSHLASPHSLFTISKTLNSWNSPGKIMTSAYLTEKHPIPMFTFFAGQWPALLANTSFLWNSSSEIYKGEGPPLSKLQLSPMFQRPRQNQELCLRVLTSNGERKSEQHLRDPG